MIGTGSMTDPYIPLEMEIGNVRKALHLIYEHGFGFTVITKSNRILSDLDLLQKINEKSKCVVQMTLITCNEDLCKKIYVSPITVKVTVPLRFLFCQFLSEYAAGLFLMLAAVRRLFHLD